MTIHTQANGHAHTRLRPHRLLRDGPGWMAFGCVVLALAPRVVTMLFMPPIQAYRLFPFELQALVVAAYLGQLGAETWGGLRYRMLAAAVCMAVGAGSAALFLASDWRSVQWAYWGGQAALEFVIVYWLAVALGKRG